MCKIPESLNFQLKIIVFRRIFEILYTPESEVIFPKTVKEDVKEDK